LRLPLDLSTDVALILLTKRRETGSKFSVKLPGCTSVSPLQTLNAQLCGHGQEIRGTQEHQGRKGREKKRRKEEYKIRMETEKEKEKRKL
jgi:hypothetical protein